MPAGLLTPTVRAAMAASLGGAEAGLVASHVTSLVREVLKWMLLGKIARTAVYVLLFGLGAVAVAMPILLPGDPRLPRNRDGGAVVIRGPAPSPPKAAAGDRRLDRYGDLLPPGVDRLGTIQRRHTKGVVEIDFTHDGSAAVSVQEITRTDLGP